MDNATTHARSMSQTNAQIVYIKNISAESFTHNYDGIPYAIEAGATLAYPYPIAMHLAKHLAMRILRSQKVKAGKVGGKDEAGRTVNMYSAVELAQKIKEIVKETIAQDLPATQTEGEIMQKKTEDMQKNFPGKDATETNAPNKTEVLKKDVIADLQKRGLKFNARDSKEALLKILIEDEKNG